jgi:two-component system, NarL family, sensor kinase
VLNRVRKLHHLRSFIIASVLRIGIVALMLIAMLVGTARAEWAQQSVLLVVYAIVAVYALILAFSRAGRSVLRRLDQFTFIFIIVDVLALTAFQFLSTDGYFPLLCMTLLPLLVGLDVSWRRAAVVLACSLVGFTLAMLLDPLMVHEMGWAKTYFRFALFVFMCYAAFMAVRIFERHANTVAGLSALREELLADTMTATEVVQRRISESIHDGPLQDVLAARLELAELATIAPGNEYVEHAQTCLQNASEQLREVTFELHPAVLDQAGLGAAVEQLTSSFTAHRTGITITTDINYPIRSAIDPIVFGVVRELLSNVMRHSHATHASITLGITDKRCLLDVADDGIGMTNTTAARHLGEGHIGLASHRARVEAAGGKFTLLEEPVGTHIRVELPLRPLDAKRAAHTTAKHSIINLEPHNGVASR